MNVRVKFKSDQNVTPSTVRNDLLRGYHNHIAGQAAPIKTPNPYF